MTKYTLTYFNARGRGEIARLLFAQAGVEYEDKRVAREDWKALKPKTPNGSIPVLQINGGEMIPQSAAITAYLAEEFGLYGDSALDRLHINSMIQDVDDLAKKWPFFEKDEELKKKTKDTVLNENILPYLKKLEQSIQKRNNCSAFFLDKVSLADLRLCHFYDFLTSQTTDDVFDATPKLKEVILRTRNLPNIKKWLETRPKTPF